VAIHLFGIALNVEQTRGVVVARLP
jgi:hypothetical protein